ncbi:MAG: 3-deoxy-D-manno-octulosonic acid transferase [Proteobacteria bacterium]|nr:3-deoxy-D-manno-octulosonic acid transferase [Pseudomonadota bacterium]
MAHAAEKTAIRVYNLVWGAAIPILRLSNRISEGFDQRTMKKGLPSADLWIQAASGGEAYLAWAIIRYLSPTSPLKILMTSSTRQGVEVLEKASLDARKNPAIDIATSYFPFDRPEMMKRALAEVAPKLTVLLELELWPGLLAALKEKKCPTLIINGRITEKSLKKYMLWADLWKYLRPDQVIAISHEDADRFRTLFQFDKVGVMPNIKFDELEPSAENEKGMDTSPPLFSPKCPSVVLGSVRQEEEPFIKKIIIRLMKKKPDTVIGLIPRHMHRVMFWKNTLSMAGIPWILRSGIKAPIQQGTVILWDVFGELSMAYNHFRAAFVGGSLAPLGGQNFLEPLKYGVKPVIGPSWKNFSWVGEEIIKEGLVRIGQNWEEVADIIMKDLSEPTDRDTIRQKVSGYIEKRKGGVNIACDMINAGLDNVREKTVEN